MFRYIGLKLKIMGAMEDLVTSLVSNMTSDSDVETTEGEPLGLLPYRFEPTSHESDASSESDSDSVLPADLAARTRIGNTAWCTCTKCAALPTERECYCCRELAHIRHLFSDVEGLQCITDHPEFVGACLNPLTLRIALVYRCDGDKRGSYTTSYSQ